ncbi:MAG: helix-turn-helix domain-containing protein [Phycisphaerae bacterium]|nr:helix-turn-helix domain-containing protein [Phycisphaerae bacterium]
MAKTFYSTDEAAKKLQRSTDGIKTLVREGKLREFRDGGAAAYKVEDVEKLASTLPPAPPPDASSASASGEIVLEPADDGDELDTGLGGSDVLSLASAESEDTAAGRPGAKKEASTGGTSVPSAGINVFDDDELDEMVDPLAQTAVTDVGGLGLEGSGSGSGILELTRESDDTSLGSELLEEIYTDKDEEAEEEAEPAGEATRAGMDEALTEVAEIGEEESAEPVAAPPAGGKAAARTRQAAYVGEEAYAGDAVSSALTATMVVALAVLWVAALGATAMLRGFVPGLLTTVYANLVIFAGAAVGVAAIAAGITFFVVKRSK